MNLFRNTSKTTSNTTGVITNLFSHLNLGGNVFTFPFLHTLLSKTRLDEKRAPRVNSSTAGVVSATRATLEGGGGVKIKLQPHSQAAAFRALSRVSTQTAE